MYLKNIVLKNIGPIEDLSIELPFLDNGDPKPVILVGENGSGKTILQSHIMDGFYEIASSLFDNVGFHAGLKRKFYKISGGTGLRAGKNAGFSLLKFSSNDGGDWEYFDKTGLVTREDFRSYISDFSLSPNNVSDNQKEISNTRLDGDGVDDGLIGVLRQEWKRGVYFYQPAHRYEEPFWKNDPFLDRENFGQERVFSADLGKEIEIITSTAKNKAFLMDLVVDHSLRQSPLDASLLDAIQQILRLILQDNDRRLGIGPRGGYRVAVTDLKGEVKIPSFDNLSLGQSILLNLVLNIVRHCDNFKVPVTQAVGIVVIDEIDVHLHTDLQSVVLPKLMQLFPKIQFIITTHSPLFLLGMKKAFSEEGFEVRNMPRGEIITTERFSEFENAYKVLRNTKQFEDDVRAKVSASTKPIVYVEGPTDVRYIKRAYELYGKNCNSFDIEIIGQNTESGTQESNNIALRNAGKLLCANLNLLKQKVILLNDPEGKIEQQEYGNLLYIRKIPKFDQNSLQKGVENLFDKEILKRAIKHRKEYIDITKKITRINRGKKSVEPEQWKVNENEKSNLCGWICENGTKDDFKNFQQIFEIIEQIIGNDS